MVFTSKIAKLVDIPEIESLIDASIHGLLAPLIDINELEASFDSMGLDDQLIKDGTYFLITDKESLVGSGGWSNRKTLFGGNHTSNRDNSYLDPVLDAAKIRAMYTHPDWSRKGVGSLIINLAEKEIQKVGFKKCELMATQSGVPLYKHYGYSEIEEFIYKSSRGNVVKMLKMGKLF